MRVDRRRAWEEGAGTCSSIQASIRSHSALTGVRSSSEMCLYLASGAAAQAAHSRAALRSAENASGSASKALNRPSIASPVSFSSFSCWPKINVDVSPEQRLFG